MTFEIPDDLGEFEPRVGEKQGLEAPSTPSRLSGESKKASTKSRPSGESKEEPDGTDEPSDPKERLKVTLRRIHNKLSDKGELLKTSNGEPQLSSCRKTSTRCTKKW